MHKVSTVLVFVLVLFNLASAQNMFQTFTGRNIGNHDLEGEFTFDEENQEFVLSAKGATLWFEKDEFYFVSQKVKGDFILSANVAFAGERQNARSKTGLMVRSGIEPDAAHVDAVVHGNGLTATQFRSEKSKLTHVIWSSMSSPEFIQVERKGDKYILSVSKNNQPLVKISEKTFDFGEEVQAGLFVCSHDKNTREIARFWNVRLEIPAQDGIDGYQNPSPSRLEILDIESGIRKVIYETETHIEAPNWSVDGEYLIYNSMGKLYRFNLENAEITEIDTDFATSNNNDHGISPDGKTLAISNATEVDGKQKSIIYTVPVNGGIPQRITEKGPSYWHGWSPDGEWLTYCAERSGNYDVYKIPAKGGEEIRLTTAEGLDDGPEFSPDGKTIFFNSTRTGTMEIWKMDPDGTNQQQVTNDKFQNWFAHPSPNGEWLIMISYQPEVPAGSHPRNKQVMLRLMPMAGGEPKTVAFLYGGQGTINVPSWSPDSKKIAFVSYTY